MVTATPTRLPEVLVIQPNVHGDARGFFSESWNQRVFTEALSIGVTFGMEIQSLSRFY